MVLVIVTLPAPVGLTSRVLPDAMVVLPLRLIAPVPVPKVPVPVWLTLPVVAMPVAPVIAPPVDTLRVLLVSWKVPVELPMAVVAVPVVLIVLLPVTAIPPAVTVSAASKRLVPSTSKVPSI